MMLQHPVFESVDAVTRLVRHVRRYIAVYAPDYAEDFAGRVPDGGVDYDGSYTGDYGGDLGRLPVGQSLHGWDGGFFIQLTRSGGQMFPPLENVDVQFDCYGDTADEAFDAARFARAAASAAPNRVAGCTRAMEVVGPLWLPDTPDAISRPRYVVDWTFTFRPRF